ncbi:chitin synthase chs-1-like [Saccostrea cucullata]|uniref:chitin synthase chs-1-like n=1 Tax=Saccostrea cuccullata TaxID=36930 RepID=UPI002ED0F8FC
MESNGKKTENGETTIPGQVLQEHKSNNGKVPNKSDGGKKKKKFGDVKKEPENQQSEYWDCPVERPPISSDDSNTCWNILTKICVIIFSVILFLIVLVTTGLTRIIIHLMIWKLNPPQANSTATINKLGGLLHLVEDRTFLKYNCTQNSNNTDCASSFLQREDFPATWECIPISSHLCQLMEETPSVNVMWIWGLVIVIVVPDIYTIILSLWRIWFKETQKFDFRMLILSMMVGALHTTGLCLLVFLVLPAFDPITASLLSYLIIFFPLVFSVFCEIKFSKKIVKALKIKVGNNPQSTEVLPESKTEKNGTNNRAFAYKFTQILGLIFFLVSLGLVSWYIYRKSLEENFVSIFCYLILSLILVSVTYWENFLIFSSSVTLGKDANQRKSSKLGRLKIFLREYIRSKREKVSLLTSICKVALTIALPYIIFSIRSTDDSNALDTVIAISLLGTSKVKTLTGEVVLESRSYFSYGCGRNDIDSLIIICVVLGFVGFKSARFACRVNLQYFCFSTPLILSLLSTPFIFVPILKFPLSWTSQDCNIGQPSWELRGTDSEDILLLIVSGCLGFVAFVLLTLYIWKNNGSKLVKCESLFRKPPYCGIFLNMSLLLTRCEDTEEQTEAENNKEAEEEITFTENNETYYTVPNVYFCATMWHETETEMTQLLKSIFRVDYEQFLQKEYENKINEKRKKMKKPLYTNKEAYDFSVHIFFDDAFKSRMNKTGTKQLKGISVNDYVKTLESVIPKTAKLVYGEFDLGEVKRYETPYGARFEWELLTSQKLVVHLKDKTKIRHRKRWSQVMYLYYLLTFKMNETKESLKRDPKNSEKMVQQKMGMFADNTFILALDGDVDFKPEAVTRLLDRMKKNPLVGAACGRIHPIGSGPMVWYQTFEYAVSHWLQKATEHVFGCVLCSPGCFSLFRGSALLADNVMKTYTRKPTEAAHYVQYDQGEDRWLCTLLLKQKYRVEYCAASDALTFAPEGFYEFYNQRRRWAPSTMANILDLLMDGNNVRKTNQNISRPYIFYHICLFISSILTPGTIFLLILGAIITAFPQIEPWLALLLNGVPVAIFIISIYVAKEETQLLFAAILSTLYSLVMLVVLIGLLKEGVEAQFCSVTTVFFCFVAGVFIIAAVLHPMEFACIFHGLLYFLSVPSMSMLLIFYSVGNLHNVNWGTRESKTAKYDDSSSQKMKKRVLGQSCSIGDWCRCILCFNEIEDTRRAVSEDEGESDEENQADKESDDKQDEKSSSKSKKKEHLAEGNESKSKVQGSETTKNEGSKDKAKATEKKNTGQKGNQKRGIYKECIAIENDEEDFWRKFIKKYLKPLNENKEEKAKIQAELIDLRNKVFFFYFITNAIFVTIVYVLTQVNAYQNTLSIPLPCSVGETQGVIEPISIAFTLVFGILLLMQFFGMLTHRVSTISHIVARTKIFDKKLDTKIPIKKLKKLVAAEEREEKKEKEDISTQKSSKWKILKAGVGLQILSGQIALEQRTIVDLRKNIESKLETIGEDSEEEEILNRFPDKHVKKLSVRGMQNFLEVTSPPLDTRNPGSSHE